MTETKPKRRWLRFSLRMLLIIVAILGAGMGWIAIELRQLHHESVIVQQLEKEGADFTPEGVGNEGSWWDKLRWAMLGKRTVEASLSNSAITDLKPLADLKYLTVVLLDHTKVTDITPLLKLKKLDWVVVDGDLVSGDQIQSLKAAAIGARIDVLHQGEPDQP